MKQKNDPPPISEADLDMLTAGGSRPTYWLPSTFDPPESGTDPKPQASAEPVRKPRRRWPLFFLFL